MGESEKQGAGLLVLNPLPEKQQSEDMSKVSHVTRGEGSGPVLSQKVADMHSVESAVKGEGDVTARKLLACQKLGRF